MDLFSPPFSLNRSHQGFCRPERQPRLPTLGSASSMGRQAVEHRPRSHQRPGRAGVWGGAPAVSFPAQLSPLPDLGKTAGSSCCLVLSDETNDSQTGIPGREGQSGSVWGNTCPFLHRRAPLLRVVRCRVVGF